VPRKLRFALLVLVVLAAVPAATAKAVARMPIGFYDDPSFRWSPLASANLAAASAAHASVVHALVDWAAAAPTQPKNPLNGNDPAYRLADIDALVVQAEKVGLQVLLTITGTPPWANGGQTQNHPPTNLSYLTQFAHMLASRYNGSQAGRGVVTMFSVWNEPNLGQFLTPQFEGTKIVSPAEYAKLFMAAYTGIKAGDPNAVVAAGETSNRGRNIPTGSPGQDTVAPGTFAQLLSQVAPNLPFVAWATHPYPSDFKFGPSQKVAFPNVAFSTMTTFGESLQKWFKRRVPIWITEYGEETKPEYFLGVSYAQQATDAREALALASANPYVQMFVWFIFRDSTSSTWFSGLEKANGQKKPAYAAFSSAATSVVGQSQVVQPGHPFNVTVAVPFLAYRDAAGTTLGTIYDMKEGNSTVFIGQPRVTLARDATVTLQVKFSPVKGQPYTLSVQIEDKHGDSEHHTIELIPSTQT
jgi:hypothetical protein